jgi:hypothetical protein
MAGVGGRLELLPPPQAVSSKKANPGMPFDHTSLQRKMDAP